MLMKTPIHSRGTTLIEVLVALVVVAVGLLGIAKMQALAIASTRTSSVRSLIAIEAASIASAMHANQAYWQGVSEPYTAKVVISGTSSAPVATVSSSQDANLAYPSICPANLGICKQVTLTAVQLAGYDMGQWAYNLSQLTPGIFSAPVTVTAPTISCNGTPVTCDIQISWMETTISMSGANASSTDQPIQTYTLAVQP